MISPSAALSRQLALEYSINPAHTRGKRFAIVGGGAMNKASFDDNNWAQIVEQLERANAARRAPERSAQGTQEPLDAHENTSETAAQSRGERITGLVLDEADFTDDFPTGFLGDDTEQSVAPSSGIRSHLTWGLGGFFMGVVCWYFIGFWGFIGDVVFPNPEHVTIVERNVEADEKPRVLSYVKKRMSQQSAESSRYCTAFHRDPETGLAVSSKCQTIVRALGVQKNTDR